MYREIHLGLYDSGLGLLCFSPRAADSPPRGTQSLLLPIRYAPPPPTHTHTHASGPPMRTRRGGGRLPRGDGILYMEHRSVTQVAISAWSVSFFSSTSGGVQINNCSKRRLADLILKMLIHFTVKLAK